MHFPSLINAQRVMWVKRLLYGKKEMKWKQYFEYSTKHVGGKFIFCCNYSIDLLNFSLPEFYIDLFRTWTETREFRGNYDNIRKEILFNNKKIRFEGRPFYSENLHLNNIFRLEHIMDRNGDLKSEAYFHSKALNYSDILIIQKIYKALPSEWKRSIEGIVAERDTDEDEMFFMKNGRRISLAMISSKDIYTVIIKNVSDKVSVREKLRNLHTREFSEKDLMAVFCRPRSSTLSCTLRDFQFRLLHGIVYVNHHLYRFKIVNDNLCSLCQKEDDKTEFLLFGTKHMLRKVDYQSCHIHIGTTCITPTKTARNLGVIFDQEMSFLNHITHVQQTVRYQLRNLSFIRKCLSKSAAEILIHALISSRLDFANSLLYNLPKRDVTKLQRLQNSAARLLTLTKKSESISPILHSLHWLPVDKRIIFKILLLIHHSVYSLSPTYLRNSIPKYIPTRNLRSSSDTLLLQIPRIKHVWGERAFSVMGPKLWNELPLQLRQLSQTEKFKSQLKTYLFFLS